MRLLTLMLFLLSMAVHGQVTITGIVKDSNKDIPLPFASLLTDTGERIISDVDGKFVLEGMSARGHFTVAYVGYTPKRINIKQGQAYYVVETGSTN
jgi:hypothetical protein